MHHLTRRQLLSTIGAATVAGALPRRVAVNQPRRLICRTRVIEVNSKAASVFAIDGFGTGAGSGAVLGPGERFNVSLINRLSEPTLIHWHGQMPPNAQDGVPAVTQPALAPGGQYHYDYRPRPGSHWMHSHVGLQRQQLFAAPLIVRTPEDIRTDMQEHVVLLHDFTFRDPDEILAELVSRKMPGHMAAPTGGHMGKMAHDKKPADRHGMHAGGGAAKDRSADHGQHGGSQAMGQAAAHLNDIEFDAYLTNDRTLDDPEVVRVERGGQVRLRLINAAASTNFLIDLGALAGQIVATDGNPVRPMPTAGLLPIAMAQRLDVIVRLPAAEGAWPILALREGAAERTGLVLATRNATIGRIAPVGDAVAPPADLRLEHHLHPTERLAEKAADRKVRLRLTGAMMPYHWGIDDRKWGAHEPVRLNQGERVELTFTNQSDMAHPMHIHGHHFKVIAINGTALDGPFRDTVLVPANGETTVAFDGGTPGRWLVHCHNAYHMAPGMMTEIVI